MTVDFAKMVDTIQRDTHVYLVGLYYRYKSYSEVDNLPPEQKTFYANCAEYLAGKLKVKYGESWKEV